MLSNDKVQAAFMLVNVKVQEAIQDRLIVGADTPVRFFCAVRARERSRKFGSLAIPAYRQGAPESSLVSRSQNPVRFNRQCSQGR